MTSMHGLQMMQGGSSSALARENEVLSVEVFAAKDSNGRVTDVFMSVPCRSGLKEANMLRLDKRSMIAMRDLAVLPVDLPEMSPECQRILLELSRIGRPLAVAEFTALGLFDAYYLKLSVVDQ